MRIKVNDKEFEVEEGDEITVNAFPCDICGMDYEITQDRGGKEITKYPPR